LNKAFEFGEIDFEEIEWRSEYRPAKLVWLSLLMPLGFALQLLLNAADAGWKFWLPGLLLPLYLPGALIELIKYKSRIVITGQGVTLKRPLLKDIEIGFAELGAIDYREDWHAQDRKALAQKIKVGATILSLDGSKQITVDEKLERFIHFAEELERRWGKALERYQGYAKGTQLRQQERYTELREHLQQMRAELLIEEKARVERLQRRLKS
jgi:hypothetical protein